jgi:hypothetical protein
LVPGEQCLWEPGGGGCEDGGGREALSSVRVTYSWQGVPVVERATLAAMDALEGGGEGGQEGVVEDDHGWQVRGGRAS